MARNPINWFAASCFAVDVLDRLTHFLVALVVPDQWRRFWS